MLIKYFNELNVIILGNSEPYLDCEFTRLGTTATATVVKLL